MHQPAHALLVIECEVNIETMAGELAGLNDQYVAIEGGVETFVRKRVCCQYRSKHYQPTLHEADQSSRPRNSIAENETLALPFTSASGNAQ